jgi:hypothetical protein
MERGFQQESIFYEPTSLREKIIRLLQNLALCGNSEIPPALFNLRASVDRPSFGGQA